MAPSPSTTKTNPPDPQSEARTAILTTLRTLGTTHHDTRTRHLAHDLHSNSAAITKQETALACHTAALAKESAACEREVHRMTEGLKPFGDLQHWAEVMEREFCVLEETLRLVEGGGEGEGESASGGSRWR